MSVKKVVIRDGATMVSSVDDILEELRYVRPAQGRLEQDLPQEAGHIELSELEHSILACFQGGELCLPDQICRQANRAPAEVSAALMGLEIKRLVVKRADGRFERR